MTPAEILNEARAAGVTVWVDGNALRYRGPREALARLLPSIKECKAELLAALQPQIDPTTMPVMASVVAACEQAFGEVSVEWAEEGGRTVGKRETTPTFGWIAPRPTVRCGKCRHFERDTIGDGSGIGACLVSGEGVGRFSPALWPAATRWCGDFEAVTP